MSKELITRNVEVELRVTDGRLGMYFCDASVSQWEVDFDHLDNYTDEELVDAVASEIEEVARHFAESLVKDLYERVIVMEAKE